MRDHRRHERGREQQVDQQVRFEDLSREEQIERDPSILERARDHIRELSLPGTPSVDHGRTLVAAGLPVWCYDRKVVNVAIARGRPRHGEMRSDDHVSDFEVQCNLDDLVVDDVHADLCPSCGSHRVVYQYHAYHYIAGGESITCLGCEETLYSDDWG